MRYRYLLLASLVSAVGAAHAQGDPAVLQKILENGSKKNQVMKHLDYLTHKIGPRLTGSSYLQKACDWTASMFKKFGCTNVHLEQWGEVAVRFDRSRKCYARMTSPTKMEFEFTSPSWTPGTDGKPLRGQAVIQPADMDAFHKNEAMYKGAWVVMTGPRRGRNAPSELDTALANAGIAGKVYTTNSDLAVTSGNMSITWDNLPKDRIVSITKKGFSALTDEIAKGGKVMLDINLDQKMVKGPFPVYNVVAEIKGTEKPDEVVIVSGHLDSWDGPGSQGAQDNGTGTMVALEAARLLNVSGAKPKRTIRFIMWTGEEQGLFGSRKYVEQHKAELDKISAVLVDDGGTNYQGGMSAIESMEPMLKAAHGDVDKYFPDMPFKITVGPRIPRGGGSDHASFNAVGVPGFFWFETGKSDYNHVHHTQFDRYETAVPEYLFQSSTNSAYMAYNLACAATMLPREAPPTAPTGR